MIGAGNAFLKIRDDIENEQSDTDPCLVWSRADTALSPLTGPSCFIVTNADTLEDALCSKTKL